jgi:hypothetical protein
MWQLCIGVCRDEGAVERKDRATLKISLANVYFDFC